MSLKNIDTDFSPRALAAALSRLGLSESTPLTIAYSGGLDSHVLLHALCRLRETVPLRLKAVHVDHDLQPASADWARRAEAMCQELNVTIVHERIRVDRNDHHGLEAAARRARYAALARHVGPGDVLLTAHHANDQAETVLLQLFRGTGVQGLTAVRELSSFSAGRLARPLLGFTRAQLANYALRAKLQWIDDTSNRDQRFARNYLRHQVFPLLEKRWPSAARQIARSTEFAAEAVELSDALAEIDYRRCGREDNFALLSVSALSQLTPVRQRNLIRYWLRKQGFQAPTALHLDHILAQVAREPRSRQAIVRWPEAEVCRYRDALMVSRPNPEMDPAFKTNWKMSEPLNIPGVGLLRAETVRGHGLSKERIGEVPLIVKLRQGGEICQLPGRAHHHKLKKLLQDAGVPPWERRRMPLVFANGELAAIGDRWVCKPFAANKDEVGWKLRIERI